MGYIIAGVVEILKKAFPTRRKEYLEKIAHEIVKWIQQWNFR